MVLKVEHESRKDSTFTSHQIQMLVVFKLEIQRRMRRIDDAKHLTMAVNLDVTTFAMNKATTRSSL
jgi:hypothetical protein